MAARVEDAITAAAQQNRIKQLGFLDERQCAIAGEICRKNHFEPFRFWGGYEGASRVLLGCFPDYVDPEQTDGLWEILGLTFRYRPVDKLSHRDFLGALMSLKVKRETIGDILVGEGICVLFALPSAAELILSEVSKIGRVGVSVSEELPPQLPLEQNLLPLSGTVASPRLDAVVAFLTNAGREKAQQMIRQGLVAVNCEAMENVSAAVDPGSRLSIRGYGRYRVETFDGVTKKGRLHITASQYQ